MVKVKRERPSQRLHHRVNAPIIISMFDECFEAVDWSLGGFRIKCGKRDVKTGDVLQAEVQIPFQGFEIVFRLDSEVCRIFEKSGELAFSFCEVGEREREIMEHFVEELVRGSVTVVEDMLVRIDTPVTPVSTKPDPNPIEDVPIRRWPIKQILLTGSYFLAGILVLGYGYAVFKANFLRMEVSSAMVTAPIEPILATADGKIERVIVKTGQTLLTNAALFVIENAKIEERIEMAKIKIERETMELVVRQKSLEAERAKSIDYRTMMLTKFERASARVRSLERQYTLARNRVERFTKLKKEGLVTKTKVEQAKAEFAIINGQFEEAIAEKRESQQFLNSVTEGRYIDGGRVNSRVLDLQAQVNLGWDKIMLAKDELMALQRHKDRLTLSAPSNGRVIKVYKGRGSSVKSGERIGLFERNEARSIQAYLTQQEILQVGLGDEALVYFPALDRSVRAVIVDIDRSSGFINERRAAYEWTNAKARNAIVRLEFLDIPLDLVRQRFLPGMPAVVNFKRRDRNNSIFQPPANFIQQPPSELPSKEVGA